MKRRFRFGFARLPTALATGALDAEVDELKSQDPDMRGQVAARAAARLARYLPRS
jgi:hypothetical protein